MERLRDDLIPAGRGLPARLPGARGRRPRGEHGAILLSSLVKFVLVIAILGTVAYDGFSIARVQVTVRDDAQQAAQVAHDAMHAGQTPAQAYQKALAYAKAHDATIVSGTFTVSKDDAVTLSVTETAPTFVAGRISAFDKYVKPVATVTASNPVL